MIKENKILAVKQLQEVFNNFSSIMVFHYKGLSVSDINSLKMEMYKCDIKMKVIKNTLASIALKQNNSEGMVDLFKGPTAIAWSNDPVSVAKILCNFAKKNNNLVLVGGIYDGKKLSQDDVKDLSNMPSLDALKSKLIAIINTPATNIAALIQKPASLLVTVLSQYSKK